MKPDTVIGPSPETRPSSITLPVTTVSSGFDTTSFRSVNKSFTAVTLMVKVFGL